MISITETPLYSTLYKDAEGDIKVQTWKVCLKDMTTGREVDAIHMI